MQETFYIRSESLKLLKQYQMCSIHDVLDFVDASNKTLYLMESKSKQCSNCKLNNFLTVIFAALHKAVRCKLLSSKLEWLTNVNQNVNCHL